MIETDDAFFFDMGLLGTDGKINAFLLCYSPLLYFVFCILFPSRFLLSNR